MASVTQRGNKWYAMFKNEDGKDVQRVTPATTKTEARRIAGELEMIAFRIRTGADPKPTPPSHPSSSASSMTLGGPSTGPRVAPTPWMTS